MPNAVLEEGREYAEFWDRGEAEVGTNGGYVNQLLIPVIHERGGRRFGVVFQVCTPERCNEKPWRTVVVVH